MIAFFCFVRRYRLHFFIFMTEEVVIKTKPEIPNGVIARVCISPCSRLISLQILRLDEDMKSKKFRVQRDSLKAINISMALFLKLLTKTCEVVQSTSTSSVPGKRAQNTLDIEHLAKAVKRYDVLMFMKDVVDEMNVKKADTRDLSSISSMMAKLDSIDEKSSGKRKADPGTAEEIDLEDEEMQESKKFKSSQTSITSFFTKAPASAAN
jgi:hypothetical protein